ncbi:MAG: hypothetical protein WC342_08240 [Methanoregula sp.]|jgi:ABC-type Fe3+-hydroxamate transport system substrate-binding protein
MTRISPYIPVLLALVVIVIFSAGCTSQTTSQETTATTVPTPETTEPVPAQTTVVCGAENCHGVTVQCGSNPVDSCTSEINVGDRCRKYATCQVVDNVCQVVTQTPYEKCKACIQSCSDSYFNNPNMLVDCSQKC